MSELFELQMRAQTCLLLLCSTPQYNEIPLDRYFIVHLNNLVYPTLIRSTDIFFFYAIFSYNLVFLVRFHISEHQLWVRSHSPLHQEVVQRLLCRRMISSITLPVSRWRRNHQHRVMWSYLISAAMVAAVWKRNHTLYVVFQLDYVAILFFWTWPMLATVRCCIMSSTHHPIKRTCNSMAHTGIGQTSFLWYFMLNKGVSIWFFCRCYHQFASLLQISLNPPEKWDELKEFAVWMLFFSHLLKLLRLSFSYNFYLFLSSH